MYQTAFHLHRKRVAMNIIEYLEDKGIDYATSGENISANWLGTRCLFCDDEKNHLGITDSGEFFNCWRCGAKGHITKLIASIEKCSFKKARDIAAKYPDQYSRGREETKSRQPVYLIDPKRYGGKIFPEEYLQYLADRGFNPNELINHYDLYAGGIVGDFKFRIIAPIIMQGKVVSLTGRDISGQARVKYLHLANEKSITPVKDCLYNIDSVNNSCIIVEGVADVWNIGPGSIATFGIKVTEEQKLSIAKKGLLKVGILFDPEPTAMKAAEKLAADLSPFVRHVEILEIQGEKDPAELSKQEVLEIRKEFF